MKKLAALFSALLLLTAPVRAEFAVNEINGFNVGASIVPPTYISDAEGQFTTSTTPTLSYTVDATADALIVAVNITDSGVDIAISGITYNGVAMTSAIAAASYSGSSTATYVSIWYLLNPAVGSAHDIVATISSGAPSNSWIEAISAKGINAVDSTASDSDAAADTTGVGVLTDSSTGKSLIVGSTTINSADTTIIWTSDGPTMNEIMADTISVFGVSTAYAEQITNGTTTVTATHNSASRPAAVFARFK